MADDIDNDESGEEQEPGVMEMSDEDFLSMPDPVEDISEGEDDEESNDESSSEESDVEETSQEKDDGLSEEDGGESENDDESGEESSETSDDSTDVQDESNDEFSDTDSDGDDNELPDKDSNSEVDFESIGKQVMAGFKANGRNMQMKSADDIITLMQKGANYHEKMVAIKPALKTVKLLDKHGLNDPEKLNYLIDLHNQNPEAITKLLKDSNIDPLDLDLKKDTNYTPEQRTVSDTEIELESVLEGIQGSQKYNETLNVITDVWDDASRNTIASNPDIIAVINGHMENGIYDKVADAVKYERSLGKLAGVSDIDAYKHMGDILDKQGLLPTGQETNQPNIPTPPQKPAVDKTKEAARKKQKKAVSPTKNKSSVDKKKDYNPISMSDEDFLKFDKTLV